MIFFFFFFVNTQKSKYFSLKMSLFNGQECCGLLVDYCDVLSAVWTLIGTHSHLHLQVHLSKLLSKVVEKFIYFWLRNKLRDHFEGSGNLCRCFELIS